MLGERRSPLRGLGHGAGEALARKWGRMFVRVCPYFTFSAPVCLNQHH